MHAKFELRLQCYSKLSDSSGLYVSFCPKLDVLAQGETLEQARAALEDSVTLFLLHCWKRGIFEEALNARGFSPCDNGEDDGSSDMVSLEEMPSERELASGKFDAWTGDFGIPFHLLEQKHRAGAGAWKQ